MLTVSNLTTRIIGMAIAVHEAQQLICLKMSGYHVGLLTNFNISRLKNGLRRFVI